MRGPAKCFTPVRAMLVLVVVLLAVAALLALVEGNAMSSWEAVATTNYTMEVAPARHGCDSFAVWAREDDDCQNIASSVRATGPAHLAGYQGGDSGDIEWLGFSYDCAKYPVHKVRHGSVTLKWIGLLHIGANHSSGATVGGAYGLSSSEPVWIQHVCEHHAEATGSRRPGPSALRVTLAAALALGACCAAAVAGALWQSFREVKRSRHQFPHREDVALPDDAA